MQSTNFKKISNYLHKRKEFSIADTLSGSFFQEELQLIHLKHIQLPSQVLFAKLIHDDQIKFKPLNCLVKHETVLPSLKDDCHPGLAHSGNDQFPICKDKEGEKMLLEH